MAPAASRLASEVVEQSIRVPVGTIGFVACAAGGAGEFVLISGDLHVKVSMTSNNNAFHFRTHFQPMGVVGLGLITGDRYHAVGVTRSSDSVSGAATATYVNNFRLISEGSGGNLQVHSNVHLSFDANGILRAEVSHNTVSCQ